MCENFVHVAASKCRTLVVFFFIWPPVEKKVGTDLFEWKKSHYLLKVDYFSRYSEISKLNRLTSEDIILHSKSIFTQYGIFEVVYSDNGPQFCSDVYRPNCMPLSVHIFFRTMARWNVLLEPLRTYWKGRGSLSGSLSIPKHSSWDRVQMLINKAVHTTVPTSQEQRKPEVPRLNIVKERDVLLKEKFW